MLILSSRLFTVFDRLTSEQRESVLIIDDSPYDRSRSKKVELLSRVFDHSTGRFIRGFRMLTICWSDGTSCLPVDFALLASKEEKKRFCGIRKTVDKRCCAYQRRKEATQKATEHLPIMVKRALATGIRAKYLLMDSWFTMPATLIALSQHIPVIGMVKKSKTIHYGFNGQRLSVLGIYRQLKKKRGRAKILVEATVDLNEHTPARLVFVRDKRKKDWLVILSTDTELSDADIVRIYGKRWDIKVFFKMAKQHLKPVKEIQSRDFDALIAHTSIVFMRYMFLAYQCRVLTDHRSFGDLFHECCQEMHDISFMEALIRILSMVTERMRQLGDFCEKTFHAFYYAAMDAAITCFGMSKNRSIRFTTNPES